jgi:hypothetical protein
MDYEPSVQEVHELIEDFARDFGPTLSFEDARRILSVARGTLRHFRAVLERRLHSSAPRA